MLSKFSIYRVFSSLFILFAVTMFSHSSSAKSADCLFVYLGDTYIDGPCQFKPNHESNDGSFRIEANGYLVQLDIFDGVGEGSWNDATRDAHLHTPLHIEGTLKREGACWKNSAVLLCSWAERTRKIDPNKWTYADAKAEYIPSENLGIGSWSEIVRVSEGGQVTHCYSTTLAESNMRNLRLVYWVGDVPSLQVSAAGLPKNYNGNIDIDYHRASGSSNGYVDEYGHRLSFDFIDEMQDGLLSSSNISFSHQPNTIYFLKETRKVIKQLNECTSPSTPHVKTAPTVTKSTVRNCPNNKALPSVKSTSPATVEFIYNIGTSRAAMIYWIDFNGNLLEMSTFDQPNQSVSFDSYVGHRWMIKDFDGTCYGGLFTIEPGHNKFVVY